jgi:FKBP-type peptidyl-prolyl cis-trans isomerase
MPVGSEDVRNDEPPFTAADFPDLRIQTLVEALAVEGEEPKVLQYGDTGEFQLVGTLASGREFESGVRSFSVMDGGEIRGLVFGTVGMKMGEVRSLFIPAELAYGDVAVNDPFLARSIPARATLIYRVELLGITKPDAGLIVRRTKPGIGDPVEVGERAEIDYVGVLAEGDRAGEEFDSSRRPGLSPYAVTIGPRGTVIDGWRIGLLGMKVREKRWLKLPPEFAYGPTGSGSIPPNATLIFEVELVSILGR